MEPNFSRMTPQELVDYFAGQEPSVSLTEAERNQLVAAVTGGVYRPEQLQFRVTHLKLEKLSASLQGFACLDTVALILDRPVVSARAGNRVEFHGFLINFTGNDVSLKGSSSGIFVPEGLHGSAFPVSYDDDLTGTLPRLSVIGPTPLFSIELSYGSLRPSDRFILGFTAPVYNDADSPESEYRSGMQAFFQINLIR